MDRTSRRTIRVVVRSQLARGDVRVLADQVLRQLRDAGVAEVLVDVSSVRRPDVVYVDALARLTLNARRHGSRVHLIGPCPGLLDVLALVGLVDMFPDDGEASDAEPHRQPEHREQPVDIEVGVDPRDPIT